MRCYYKFVKKIMLFKENYFNIIDFVFSILESELEEYVILLVIYFEFYKLFN